MPGKSPSHEKAQVARKKAKKVPAQDWVKHPLRYQQSAESMRADMKSQVPCPERSDRFHVMSMRRAIEPFKTGTPPLTVQQMFWRTAGARFLVAESSHSSALGDADLESELGIANAEGRDLKKLVADFEDDPVMTPRMLSRSARRAYLKGWLSHLDDGWLYDQGALVVALTIGDMVPSPCAGSLSVARAADAAHANWNREYGERVAAATKKLQSFCTHAQAAYNGVLAVLELKRSAVRSNSDEEGPIARSCQTVALRALKKLEFDLTETLGCKSLVRWSALDASLTDQIEVDGDLLSEPELVFLRDVRRAIKCLSSRPRQGIEIEAASALARSIWHLHVGIAWVDVLYDREKNKLLCEVRPEPLDIDEDTKWVSPCLSESPVAQNPSSG